ncbi:uncharacterized protein MYCFIDRAFT_170814 [Pseudocercospora fijiensis CIRAD86]|uniref:Uncharacterized protein n=1 Tax=Pseudocercospora fijiensis (strain CIRAD86) TaxID=383855 RepID=N1Q905_PSEFD|nr:uncharacterized protein MYCFIDRAFT_170814 [Pseudocercospora fijiensis CIRAD86]EME89359.1 hypothetical protein MYCFIDRAFT_170814 [Pseudocercospora fijiensis CIRAD86]
MYRHTVYSASVSCADLELGPPVIESTSVVSSIMCPLPITTAAALPQDSLPTNNPVNQTTQSARTAVLDSEGESDLNPRKTSEKNQKEGPTSQQEAADESAPEEKQADESTSEEDQADEGKYCILPDMLNRGIRKELVQHLNQSKSAYRTVFIARDSSPRGKKWQQLAFDNIRKHLEFLGQEYIDMPILILSTEEMLSASFPFFPGQAFYHDILYARSATNDPSRTRMPYLSYTNKRQKSVEIANVNSVLVTSLVVDFLHEVKAANRSVFAVNDSITAQPSNLASFCAAFNFTLLQISITASQLEQTFAEKLEGARRDSSCLGERHKRVWFRFNSETLAHQFYGIRESSAIDLILAWCRKTQDGKDITSAQARIGLGRARAKKPFNDAGGDFREVQRQDGSDDRVPYSLCLILLIGIFISRSALVVRFFSLFFFFPFFHRCTTAFCLKRNDFVLYFTLLLRRDLLASTIRYYKTNHVGCLAVYHSKRHTHRRRCPTAPRDRVRYTYDNDRVRPPAINYLTALPESQTPRRYSPSPPPGYMSDSAPTQSSFMPLPDVYAPFNDQSLDNASVSNTNIADNATPEHQQEFEFVETSQMTVADAGEGLGFGFGDDNTGGGRDIASEEAIGGVAECGDKDDSLDGRPFGSSTAGAWFIG